MKTQVFCFFVLNIILADAHVPQLDGRIIGGVDANITEFPYQVSLRKFNAHVCGGTIFHNSYILTAAHCVASGLARSFSIHAGTDNLNNEGTIIKVCSMTVHQNYSSDTMINDIAILKLCTPLKFSNSILPISLAKSGDTIAAGTTGIVSGFGYTAEGGDVSTNLKKVEVPIITNARCQVLYEDEIVTDNMICAGYIGVGQKDACQGDSGGPLQAKGKLYGVVSWGYGCARPLFPGVYTQVAKYRNWIRSIANC